MLSLVSCGEKDIQINELSDLSGKSITFEMGSIHAQYIMENSEIENPVYDYSVSSADALSRLLAGKSDAFVTDYLMAQSFVKEYDGLKILSSSLGKTDYAFAFQTNSELIDLFNRELKALKLDGTIHRIIDKWAVVDPIQLSVDKQDWDAPNGTLTCLLDASVEPICFLNIKGEFAGIDIDIIQSIAKRLGYKVEFRQESFSDILPMISAGIADLACSGISITEERKAMIDFSDSYYTDLTAIIVKDGNRDTGIKREISRCYYSIYWPRV